MTLSDRLRARLRDALADRKLSQRAVADRLTKFTGTEWNQVKVGRVLNGGVELKVDDVALLAGLAGLSLVELFREPGREFVADLTPSELRLLDAVRARPEVGPAIVAIIGTTPTPRKPSRRVIRERMRLDR